MIKAAITPDIIRKKAKALHKKSCPYNSPGGRGHTEGCGWEYDLDMKDPWEGYAHRLWYEKAEAKLKKTQEPIFPGEYK